MAVDLDRARDSGVAAPAAVSRARRGSRLGRAVLNWVPGFPFVVVAGGLLAGSAGWLVLVSFSAPRGGFTLQAWADVLGPGLNRTAIVNSIELSAVVATLCVLVGTPLAWFLAHLGDRSRSVGTALMNAAANFGGASLAVAFVATLGTLGFLRLLVADWFGVGLPIDLFGFWGLVAVFCYFIVPLYVLLVMPAMGALRPEWWEAAQVASAGRLEFWRRVGIPVLGPFVVGGWALTFAWAIGQFSVVFALVGSESRVPLITQRIGALLLAASASSNRFQRAAALSVLLIVFAAVALVIYRLLSRRSLQWLDGGAR